MAGDPRRASSIVRLRRVTPRSFLPRPISVSASHNEASVAACAEPDFAATSRARRARLAASSTWSTASKSRMYVSSFWTRVKHSSAVCGSCEASSAAFAALIPFGMSFTCNATSAMFCSAMGFVAGSSWRRLRTFSNIANASAYWPAFKWQAPRLCQTLASRSVSPVSFAISSARVRSCTAPEKFQFHPGMSPDKHVRTGRQRLIRPMNGRVDGVGDRVERRFRVGVKVVETRDFDERFGPLGRIEVRWEFLQRVVRGGDEQMGARRRGRALRQNRVAHGDELLGRVGRPIGRHDIQSVCLT